MILFLPRQAGFGEGSSARKLQALVQSAPRDGGAVRASQDRTGEATGTPGASPGTGVHSTDTSLHAQPASLAARPDTWPAVKWHWVSLCVRPVAEAFGDCGGKRVFPFAPSRQGFVAVAEFRLIGHA